ncbi:MAG TPA: HAMP domain-containing sensor histidine kinase [Candidatus Eisenbacteria bacterium]|nr:HAMP domain-containing sensor histidine kinase [Candidatus Eisenbacteria bacterium]
MTARPADPARAGRPLRPISFRVYLFVGAIVLMVALVFNTNIVIARLNDEARSLCTVLARFFAVATFEAAEDPDLQPIFRDVVRNINFPLVLTDTKGIPRAWRHVGILARDVPDSLIARAESTGVLDPSLVRLQDIVVQLDRVNEPIPIVRTGVPNVLGYVHYGEPPLVSRLRWIPYLEFGVIVGLLIFGFAGWRSLLAGEQRSLWGALAKETAHQLGTPISSLLGWTGILREQAQSGALAPEKVTALVDEMDRDLDRLHKIASRFAQVGSTPALEPADLTTIVSATVAYFRTRLPHLGQSVVIEERYDPAPRVMIHPQLMEWVVENLLKNALDASDKQEGTIAVSVLWRREAREVELRVTDNGRGMSPEDRRHAFDTGFTTKRRGWGLGLALARRVVHEYHGGSIAIVESAPGRGTTVTVTLPVPPSPTDGRAA